MDQASIKTGCNWRNLRPTEAMCKTRSVSQHFWRPLQASGSFQVTSRIQSTMDLVPRGIKSSCLKSVDREDKSVHWWAKTYTARQEFWFSPDIEPKTKQKSISCCLGTEQDGSEEKERSNITKAFGKIHIKEKRQRKILHNVRNCSVLWPLSHMNQFKEGSRWPCCIDCDMA